VVLEELTSRFNRVNDQATKELWAEIMGLKLKRGDDAEVAPATPDPPEQLRMRLLGGGYRLTVRRHHFARAEAVDREAELP
jgi:hypothetical protein